MGFIYKITSPNNREYVGKTYDLRKRINCHKSAARRKEDSIILLNSIRKYGWDAHILEVIEECPDELLNEREIFWIAELKTYCYDYPGQMNMTKGGEGQRSTWMHDKKRRKELSEKMKGEGNYFFGKKHTKEMKEWLSEYSTERNKRDGRTVPEWGAEKGWEAVRKEVVCYDSNGVFVNEFISVTAAGKSLGILPTCISATCNGHQTNANGYIFRYKTEGYPKKIEVGALKSKTIKRPICLLSKDLKIMREFPSGQEASDFLGVPKGTINRAAKYNNLNPIRTGHIFCYKDDYLKEYSLVA